LRFSARKAVAAFSSHQVYYGPTLRASKAVEVIGCHKSKQAYGVNDFAARSDLGGTVEGRLPPGEFSHLHLMAQVRHLVMVRRGLS